MLCIAKGVMSWAAWRRDQRPGGASMATKEALVSEWLRGNAGTAGHSEIQRHNGGSHHTCRILWFLLDLNRKFMIISQVGL